MGSLQQLILVVLGRADPQVCPFSHFSGWIGPEREPPRLAANRWASGVRLSKCGDARRAQRTGVSRSQKYADSAFLRLGRSPIEQSSRVHRLRLLDEQAGRGRGQSPEQTLTSADPRVRVRPRASEPAGWNAPFPSRVALGLRPKKITDGSSTAWRNKAYNRPISGGSWWFILVAQESIFITIR